MGGGESTFRMEDLGPEARRSRLDPDQARALAEAVELSARMLAGEVPGRPRGRPVDRDALRDFLSPLAVFGMDPPRMLRLLGKVPADWPLDHREMYYDFRLERWQKHLEPPSISGLLDEYADNAPTPEEGLAYLRGQWAEFLKRRGAGP